MFDTMKSHLALRGHRVATHLAREDGNIATLAVIMFVMMLSVGGLAVDLMRYEEIRTSLQQSLDRCTLAGASLTQEMDPETVCRDYVAKAGHTEDLTDVTVTEGANFREVSADAMAYETPFFAHMVGIDNFDIPAASVAEQRISDIEIAMVLDISGSMQNTPSRITNLKIAGKEFVQSVLETDAENRTSILIVPYNGQVNLGPVLRSKFNVTLHSGQTGVDCVDLPGGAYSNATLSRVTPLPATAHADTFSGTSLTNSAVSPTDGSNAIPNWGNRWCPITSTGTALSQNIVRMPNNNIGVLQGQIDGLTAIGATSINAGMKWGLALLDPASRPLYTEMIGAPIPAAFAGRPFDYTPDNAANPTSMKVIILMTDGEHYAEERVADAYKANVVSPIYRASDGQYSIRFTSGRPAAAGTNEYWTPHLGTWRSTAYNGGGGVSQRTWPQVWTSLRLSYVAWQFYARALGTDSTSRTNAYNTWIGNFRLKTPTTAMDAQLDAVCQKARENNVIVFGIAFEAPANGKAVIQSCATDNSHYFETQGADLRTAFRSIASQISQLRLTQ